MHPMNTTTIHDSRNYMTAAESSPTLFAGLMATGHGNLPYFVNRVEVFTAWSTVVVKHMKLVMHIF